MLTIENLDIMTTHPIIQLFIYTLSGFLFGLFLHKIIMPKLSKIIAKTSFKYDDLIVLTIRKWVIPWFLVLGLFFGLKQLNLDLRFYFWIQNGLLIFYIFSSTIIISKVVSGLIKIKASDSDTFISSSSIISNIVIVTIYSIGILIILQTQGISITPVLTALGVGGLAVALALQNTLSNLFAGLQIISSGNFIKGSFIKIASGEDGCIEDITWRSTTIRTLTDHIIIVPNAKLADMIVSNFNLPKTELSFIVEIGVSYDSDLTHVELVTKQVIKQIMEEVEGGVSDFEPVIRYFSFGDSSIQMKATLRVKDYVAQFDVKSAFIKKLHIKFIEQGINIPFPTRTVYSKKED